MPVLHLEHGRIEETQNGVPTREDAPAEPAPKEAPEQAPPATFAPEPEEAPEAAREAVPIFDVADDMARAVAAERALEAVPDSREEQAPRRGGETGIAARNAGRRRTAEEGLEHFHKEVSCGPGAGPKLSPVSSLSVSGVLKGCVES